MSALRRRARVRRTLRLVRGWYGYADCTCGGLRRDPGCWFHGTRPRSAAWRAIQLEQPVEIGPRPW